MSPQTVGGLNLLNAKPFVAGLLEGYENEYVTGLNRIKLGGIESPIQFNGFTLNNRSTADAVFITSIDGLEDADVRDTRDVNPGYDGETAFNSLYGGRTIVLNGFLRAGTLSKLRDMQEGLKSVFAPLDEKPLIIKGVSVDRDLQIYCRKSQPITMSETQEGFQFKRQFQVTLRASDFRFTSTSVYYKEWQNASAFNDEIFATSVNNLGNYLADTVIKVEGPINSNANGSIGLQIKNTVDLSAESSSQLAATSAGGIINAVSSSRGLKADGRELIELKAKNSSTTEVVGEDEYLLIDSKNRSIFLFDQFDVATSAYNQLSINSEWLNIVPGSNPIYVKTYSSCNPKITFYYRHTFI
jgi:hypothetical protein